MSTNRRHAAARAWVAAAAVALSALPGRAADLPPVRITGHGRYIGERGEPVQDRPPGSTGVTSFSPSAGGTLIETTTRIEARLCTRFGIRVDLPPEAPGHPAHVTVRLTHPLLVNPDGRRGTVATWPQTVDAAGATAWFSFDEPWEVVPGTWTFAILSDGAVLAEQAFELVAPARPGPVQYGCGAPVS